LLGTNIYKTFFKNTAIAQIIKLILCSNLCSVKLLQGQIVEI
jgi:hypothetical protein